MPRTRGKPVQLPQWWLEALNRLCDGETTTETAARLNAVARRDPPFHRTAVGDFLRGDVTTYEMMAAFLVLYPDLPPPMFFASSYEEAHQHQQIARRYSPKRGEVPRVEQTIEDTGEKTPRRQTTRSGVRTPTGKRAIK